MTPHDLLEWHRAQVRAVEAYFGTVDTDAKTKKSYRKTLRACKDRADLVEKLIDAAGLAPAQSTPQQTTGEM